MAQLIVRDLDDRIIEALEARASRHQRPLEAELRVILERAAAERIGRSLEGRPHGDSAALIREDRGR